MDNELSTKRRLIITLVVATVVIFVALVWLITALRPWKLLGAQNPSQTANRVLVERDCTHSIAYWKAHPELYPPQVFMAGVIYHETELEALLSDETQDLAQQLKAQSVVAFLNGQAGADQRQIEATLFEAYGWLEQHSVNSQITQDELDTGQRLFQALEAFNLGLAGVESCEKTGPVSGKVTATKADTAQGSLTSGMTLTPTPSQTPSPTGRATSLVGTASSPTVTPSPTTIRPGYPSLTPTRTSQPPIFTATSRPPSNPTPTNQPSNTPIPPSPTSAPSDTPIPPSPTTAPTDTPIPPSPTTPPTATPIPPSPTLPPPATPIPPTPTLPSMPPI